MMIIFINLFKEKYLLSWKDTDYPVSLRNVCIEECPSYTKIIDDKLEF